MDNNKELGTLLAFGLVTTVSTTALLQPMDRLKTLKQQLDPNSKLSSFRIARNVVKDRGFFELWKGTVPSVLRAAPGASLYLSIVNVARTRMKVEDRDGRTLFLVGFLTRMGLACALQPATMIKARLESTIYKDLTIRQSVRTVIRELGTRGLWRGLLPTLLRDAPYSGTYLMFYRRQLQLLEQRQQPVRPLLRFGCGLVSGFLACLLTQPFDVVKTVVQLYPKTSPSVFRAGAQLFKEHGIAVFFRGYLLRASRRTLMAALNWTIFDEIVQKVNQKYGMTSS